jgi:hypothetical protein
MKEIRITGILTSNRIQDAESIQAILTKFGCSIKTRLGLHEFADNDNEKYGLILLELIGDKSEWDKLEKELSRFPGLQIQHMDFQL